MSYINEGSGVPYSRYLGLDATESELRRTIADPAALIVEWENAGLTFVASEREHVIARCGAMGGDVLDVQGGWKYFRKVDFLKEWNEIRTTAGSFRRGQGKVEKQ